MKETDSIRPAAKKHSLDLPRYASIEFPLNVVNDDKAIELVGGKERIRESLVEKNVQLQLRLRPSDPYQHAIHSDVSTAENFLVRIRLPKGELHRHGGDLQQAIAANQGKYLFEPVAIINKNFRFREMADFQVNASSNALLKDVTDTFFGNDFSKLKQFETLLNAKDQYDISKPLELPPFSTFSKIRMPFSYNYTNNKGTVVRAEDGSVRLVNKNQPFKVNTSFVPWDAPAPTQPTLELANYLQEAQQNVHRQLHDEKLPLHIVKGSSSYQLVECVKLLEQLFLQKPIWLRRHLYSIMPTSWRNIFRYALAYVAYTSRTGLWKQSYIRFGCDPKSSSKYAIYQTERFRVHTSNKQNGEGDDADEDGDADEPPDTEDDPNIDSSIALSDKDAVKELPRDFLFFGNNIPKISSFQLNDIKDPQLCELLVEENLVDTVTERDGWFQPTALAQFRLIMKYKLTCLASKEPVSETRVEQVREMAINRYYAKLEQANTLVKEGSDEDDDEDEAEDEDEDGETADAVAEGDLLSRLRRIDPHSMHELRGIIMQEDLMDVDTNL